MKPFPVFLFLITSILSISNKIAANLTWTGNNSSNWGDSTNWNPSGIPGQNDTANIYSGTFNPQLNSNTSLYRLNLYSGTIDLNGYLLTISANANYSGGQLSNGQLKHYGTGTITIAGTIFNAKVHITANSILLNDATFNDSLTVVKKGTSPDNSKAGNFFNYPVSLTDSASANIILSDSLPDSFGSTLEIANRSSGKVYIAHRGETVAGPFNWRPEWIGTSRAFSGRFLINDRNGAVKAFVNGRIVLAGDRLAEVYLYDPPIFLKNHRHGRCMQLLRPNEKWFKLHFENPPRDFSAAYMYVEQLLKEAYCLTH